MHYYIRRIITEVSGVSSSDTYTSKHNVNLCIKMRDNTKNPLNIESIILSKLMMTLPIKTLDVDKSKWMKYTLADAHFNKPSRVDIIIGVV